jgi:hypothetical protein
VFGKPGRLRFGRPGFEIEGGGGFDDGVVIDLKHRLNIGLAGWSYSQECLLQSLPPPPRLEGTMEK